MKILRYRPVILLGLIVLSIWQAYAGSQSMFDPVMSGVGGKFGWVWLVFGPVSFFAAASFGTIFAYFGLATRLGSVRKFWSLLLWLAILWLGCGALVFGWADWFGTHFGFTIGEHMRHFFLILLPMLAVVFCLWTVQQDMKKALSEQPIAPISASEGRPPALGGKTTHLAFRWIGALLAAVGSIVAVVVSGLLLLMWGCEPATVATLAHRFPNERKDLETIIAMSDQDSQMAVIDPGWLELQGQSFPASYTAVGISAARWEEYRSIFRRNGITQGIRRYAPKGDAFIIVKSIGLLDNGHSNGYLYCVPGAKHIYAPCSSTEKYGEHSYSSGDEAYEFIKLTDRWYAFRQGPG